MNHNIIDYGKKPLVIDMYAATLNNDNFRRALWTGENLQLTLMCIKPGEDIDLEVHPEIDQFIYIVCGKGLTQIGNSKNNLPFKSDVYENTGIFIPAGTWHNITNTGKTELKLFTVYAPPEHPFGTLENVKEKKY